MNITSSFSADRLSPSLGYDDAGFDRLSAVSTYALDFVGVLYLFDIFQLDCYEMFTIFSKE